MHNRKVLLDKPNETEINNCNCRNEDTCPLPNSCQTKCIIYQANIDSDIDIGGYKQKNIVSGITKSHSTTLNIVIIRNYQNHFGKSKNTMEH